mmetsp:Transcript_21695/g.67668  ORF Transcript_21695/g.67668 Transcript_21695/m.67668 type:complete len:214 (-) Transcript_21695:723-1364(-)
MQKSLCLISSFFSCTSSAIWPSRAFFTRLKASIRTLYASAASFGLPSRRAAAAKRSAACARPADRRSARRCSREVPSVRSKRACDLSELSTAMALETASISTWRAFWRTSNSLSVLEHLLLRVARNSSSAASWLRVSSRSSLLSAFSLSVAARSCVLLSSCSCPAAISASLAFFSSSYSCWFSSSSVCVLLRFDSKVSCICWRMPKISPDCGA